MKISKQDWGYVPVNPDPDFDPENNKRIINETIKKSKLLAKRKEREHLEKVAERNAAIAQYLKSIGSGKTNSKVTEYFGRREMARLRGEEILGAIRAKIGDATKQKIYEKAKTHALKS